MWLCWFQMKIDKILAWLAYNITCLSAGAAECEGWSWWITAKFHWSRSFSQKKSNMSWKILIWKGNANWLTILSKRIRRKILRKNLKILWIGKVDRYYVENFALYLWLCWFLCITLCRLNNLSMIFVIIRIVIKT